MTLSSAERMEAGVRAVVDWRRSELVRAGYPHELAEAIARRGDIDLNEALSLRARGCPARLAWEILR